MTNNEYMKIYNECLNRFLDKLCYDCNSYKYMAKGILDDGDKEKMNLLLLLDENEYSDKTIK